MKFFPFPLLLLSLIFWQSEVLAKQVNVKDYGAVGDGKHLETESVQKAIDDMSINGGTVVFPSGTYLSGTVYFKSNVTLRLEKGSVLLGSTDLKDYPENLPDYTFFRKGIIKRALIFAENCQNIAIEGEGTIDGQGQAFEEPKEKGINSYSVRPYVIWMIRCKNVRTEGIKLQNSALWMQHYLGCENVYIHDIEVYNHANKNNDMVDIDGCRDVIISDCRGDTDDDGITLKSTHGLPNENITITNCILSSHCNAIKCGTESNTGFKNITISNCVIRPSKDTVATFGVPQGISGISLEVVDGAEMNGINISNIVMDGPEVPIFIRLGNRARGYDDSLPKPETGSIENITITNITAFHAKNYGSSITGIPDHPVKNITLENIRFFYSGGGMTEDAQKEIPEMENSYPEAVMFGELPAYGLFIRHAENLSLRNIEFHLNAADARPPLYIEDLVNGKLEDIQADVSPTVPFIKAKNIQDIYIQNPRPLTKCASVISLTGALSEFIALTDIHKRLFKQIFSVSEGVQKDIVATGTIY